MEVCRRWQLADGVGDVSMYVRLTDVVRTNGEAPGLAVETAASPHFHVGEDLHSACSGDRVKRRAALRNQERRQNSPRNVVLRAVFMYIDHMQKPYKPGSELVTPAGLFAARRPDWLGWSRLLYNLSSVGVVANHHDPKAATARAGFNERHGVYMAVGFSVS